MTSVYTNLYFNQPLVVLDTTSSSQTSASLFLYGGFTSLGASTFGGISTYTNTTQSTSTSDGAIIMSGGIGIQKNANVGGNVVISGSLTAGSFFTANIQTTSITATNMLSTNITSGYLSVGTSTIANLLNTHLTSGHINATDMTISSLLASSQISTGALYSSLATITNLVATNMTSGSFAVEHFIATNITAGIINANTRISSASVYAPLATISNIVATASSSGTLNVTTGVTSGTLLAINTDDATGVATGGSLTVLGGAAVSKKLYVGTSLYANTRNITPSLGDIWSELSFSASNNQSSAADVTDLVFDNAVVRAFNTMVSITIVRSVGGNLYANFELKGIQKGSGWVVNSSYVGDYTGIVFSITASGQVQYTSTNQLSWTSSTMKFRGYTTSV